MRRVSDILFSLLIPALILLHLYFAPYTKVEESFNIQAIHDILTYGIPVHDVDRELRQHYDHITFSGAVPRTFLGPVLLAGASWPWIQLSRTLEIALSRQSIVRGVLGLFNAYCLISFRYRVAKTFGRTAANWYVLFQASQFHLMYYASRTLPNIFAFGLTTLVARNLLPLAGRSPSSRSNRQRQSTALIILTATTTVFRSELAILLASYTIYMFLHPSYRLTILNILFSGLLGATIGLALSVPLDTFFWRSSYPLWSEFAAFKFNVLSAKASEWGTSPWNFYFTSSLPRLLYNPILLFLLPFTLSISILRRQSLDILVPNLLYIAIYSFQPHKEWRFIIYTIPPLLAVASAGASWIWIRRSKNLIYRGLSLVMVASVLGALIASAGMCAISAQSYPGGEALERLHEIGRKGNETGAKVVHMDTLACMTGVTRFGQQQASEIDSEGVTWVYDKTEEADTLLERQFWDSMDYALAENPNKVLGNWDVVDIVEGFSGFKLARYDQDRSWSGSGDGLFKSFQASFAERHFNDGTKGDIFVVIATLYEESVYYIRQHFTKGWWVEIKTEPKIQILRRSGNAAKEEEPLDESVASDHPPNKDDAVAAEIEPMDEEPVKSK